MHISALNLDRTKKYILIVFVIIILDRKILSLQRGVWIQAFVLILHIKFMLSFILSL